MELHRIYFTDLGAMCAFMVEQRRLPILPGARGEING
jgi:hypothetical protein